MDEASDRQPREGKSTPTANGWDFSYLLLGNILHIWNDSWFLCNLKQAMKWLYRLENIYS